MAVESRFVVIRHGVEVETFMDKKTADEYDKMLDMADNLSEMFEKAPIELSENVKEELSIYLAQQRDNVLIALQAKKAKTPKVSTAIDKQKSTTSSVVADEVKIKETEQAVKSNTKKKVTVKNKAVAA